MKFKTTYVFLAVFAALAAYLYLVDEPQQVARQQAEERQGLVLPGLDAAAVTAVTVRGAKGTVRVERGEGKTWRVAAPVSDRANANRVGTLLGDLAALKAQRQVAAPDAALEPYGLAEPAVTIALEGPALTLTLGGENPAGDARYLRVGNGPVQVVPSHQAATLELAPAALRQPELLAEAPWDQLTAVAVKTGAGPSLRLEQDGGRWWLRQPLATEADPEAVSRLTEKLHWARASSFPDPGERADDALAAGCTVTLEWGTAAPPVTVALAPVDGAVWARASGRDAVLAVPQDVWDAVQVAPETLRRRKPLQLKAWRVRSLGVTRGDAVRSYAKTDGAWGRDEKPLDTAEADALQALLQTLEDTAADTVIDAPGDAAVYGFDPPWGKVAVELDAGAHQQIVLGQVGDVLYAREVEGTGPVYALPAAFGKALEELLAAPDAGKPTP